MTNQVYYRKWRPKRFEDLIGQEAVARTLKQAIARNRIAHAYLFCGSRGTGKTSTARILAKAVNCLAPQDGEPCDQCRMCVAVNEGRFLDLVEIDAASNRRIEDMRDLLERMRYSPSEGKYKVYVLDEAHMLTADAETALLKTLEEPPPHVIFILATTDQQKLKDTIVSRCQRYDFKRIGMEATAQNLARICEAEGIQADPAALRAIARNADGSMRDAESVLEQAVTAFGSPLTQEQVHLLLGLTDDERVRQLVSQTLRGQTPEALATLSAIAATGANLRQLHRQMVEDVRDLLLTKAGAGALASFQSGATKEQSQLLQAVPMERLLQALRQLGQVTFRPEAPPTLSLELAIIESTQGQIVTQQPQSQPQSHAPAIAERPAVDTRAPVRQPMPAQPQARQPSPQPAARQERPAQAPIGQPVSRPAYQSPAPASAQPVAPLPENATPDQRLHAQWSDLLRALGKQKARRFVLGSLLRDCRSYRLDGNTLHLEFKTVSNMDRFREEMDTPEGQRMFQETFTRVFGLSGAPTLDITNGGTQKTDKANRSPLVQAALSMGGRIIEETEENEYHE